MENLAIKFYGLSLLLPMFDSDSGNALHNHTPI